MSWIHGYLNLGFKISLFSRSRPSSCGEGEVDRNTQTAILHDRSKKNKCDINTVLQYIKVKLEPSKCVIGVTLMGWLYDGVLKG